MSLLTLQPASTSTELAQKRERLASLVREMGSVVVGYSGGIDSTLVAAVAHEELGDRALMVIARSESYPRAELDLAVELAVARGWNYRILETREIEREEYRRNDGRRCYHCKSELFDHLQRIARDEGFARIAYGANLDDMGDWRPGHEAAREHAVSSPLYEAGLGKAEIRALAREMGLSNWDKPAMACLSSRVPYGTEVTPELLGRIEQAEAVLRSHGFHQFRVRHHDTVARIEIPATEFGRLLDPPTLAAVTEGIRAVGYHYVTLDLNGFQSGSMNRVLDANGGAGVR